MNNTWQSKSQFKKNTDPILFTIKRRTLVKCLDMFTVSLAADFEFDGSTTSEKKLGQGQTKGWKSMCI